MRALRAEDLDHDELRIAEVIAARVVEIVRDELQLAPNDEDWIDAKEVARRFGLSRAWVYAHARQLGAVPIGSGSKPRLRFIPGVVAEALQRSAEEPASAPTAIGPVARVPIHVPQVRSKRSVQSDQRGH